MKKSFTALVALLLILTLIGCSEQTDTPTAPEQTPPAVETTPTPPEPPEPSEPPTPAPTNEETGVIVGDVFYKDTPVSQLFTEPFLDVLGDAIDQRDAFFFYEGVEIMGDRGDLLGHDIMAIQLDVFEPYLGMFELNGVALDMTRTELIHTFGSPFEESGGYVLWYQISSPTVAYMLWFSFEDSGGNIPASNMKISRIAQEDASPITSETTPEQLLGTWHNDAGTVLTFPDATGTPDRWEMWPVPNGAYRIKAIFYERFEDGSRSAYWGHNTFWLFPVGVEMVRYGGNMSLVPSDTSVARLYQGPFEVTACCPDDDILLEVFYRTTE